MYLDNKKPSHGGLLRRGMQQLLHFNKCHVFLIINFGQDFADVEFGVSVVQNILGFLQVAGMGGVLSFTRSKGFPAAVSAAIGMVDEDTIVDMVEFFGEIDFAQHSGQLGFIGGVSQGFGGSGQGNDVSATGIAIVVNEGVDGFFQAKIHAVENSGFGVGHRGVLGSYGLIVAEAHER